MVFAVFTSAVWAQQTGNSHNAASGETPARLLVIASDASDPLTGSLVKYLENTYPVSVTAIEKAEYRSLIDERLYDGFVYFGQAYYQVPPPGFMIDMARTSKPVLWLNYHAWHLEPASMERLGLRFFDRHDTSFTKVYLDGILPLTRTDTSLVRVRPPARVLYRLFNDDLSASVPGAAVSGNLTYVSYLPTFAPLEPDLAAFRIATDAAFSQLKARVPAPLAPAERLAAAWADVFRDGVHLPYDYDPALTDIIGYDDDSFHERLLRIKDAGAEWVTISRTYFQDGVKGTNIAPHAVGTASYSALRHLAQDAHDIGLHVRLSIIVNLAEESRRPNDWRGFIRPTDAEEWWRTYRKIVLRAAEFAQSAGIESLNIGAELNAMQAYEDQWRALVADVRGLAGFAGLVGYQVNYNGLYNMTWGDALDYLSVAAYWPLADTRDPDLEELIASWKAVGEDLADWSNAHPGVNIEFGEVGYVSQPYTAEFPFSWKPNRAGQLNLNEQLNGYLALLDFLKKTPAITGVGLFASTRYDLIPDDTGYTPFGKPAEDVAGSLLNLR